MTMAADADPPDGKSSWGLTPGDEAVPGCFVVAPLGGGKRFEVFSAFDDRLLSRIVLKVLRPEFLDRPRTLAALRREIDILMRVDHPHVVHCFHASAEGERPYLALERLSGRTLSATIRRGGPSEPSAAISISLALAAASHYLHEHGLVHLDIKPSNVIVAGPPRLIDFSLARTDEQARAITMRVGTGPWMAPEQCDPPRTGTPCPASDIWGIGATFYYAISGRKPFASPSTSPDDPIEVRYPQLSAGPRPLPDDVPDALRDAVMWMMQPAPESRPNAREVHRQLVELSHLFAGSD
jgi:eukaryotic-like serine/threonine-protein kinase